jgi:hypothetical protein
MQPSYARQCRAQGGIVLRRQDAPRGGRKALGGRAISIGHVGELRPDQVW